MTGRPVTAAAGGPPEQAGPPVVELRAVGVSFRGQRALPRRRGPARRQRRGTRLSAVRGVDLIIRTGEMVTLTGQDFSPKSTLLHVVGLLLRPTSGTYLLNGLDTARLGDRDRSALRGREIGLMLQPPRLLPDRSALDNVALPLLYTAAPGRIRSGLAFDWLERVGLASQARRPAGDLSAGERQRVAMARALVRMPGLLVCEDPTAGLEAEHGAQIIGLLAGLRSAGRTILVATRDQLIAAHSSRCVSIGGRCAAQAGAYP